MGVAVASGDLRSSVVTTHRRSESGSHILTERGAYASDARFAAVERPRLPEVRSAISVQLASHHELYLCCSRALS